MHHSKIYLFTIIQAIWRRECQPTPVFLLGESPRQRSLAGYSLRGRKESDTTEQVSIHTSNTCLHSCCQRKCKLQQIQVTESPLTIMTPTLTWLLPEGTPVSLLCQPFALLLPTHYVPQIVACSTHKSICNLLNCYIKKAERPKNWCFWTVVLEKTLESPLDCKEIQPVHPKDQSWVFTGRTDVEAETPILWPPDAKSWLIWKDPDAGKDWGQEEKGMTEDEMVGWYRRLNGREFGWTLGVGDGQGGLACCGTWGHKESDTTERLNWTVPIYSPTNRVGYHLLNLWLPKGKGEGRDKLVGWD